MRHLRKNGIDISGTRQKRLLINTGYYHGYKGYRFFKLSSDKIPFTTYNEIYATIQYDSKLKALLYEKIMFLETAIKNIAIDVILRTIRSNSIYDMYDQIVESYRNAPDGASEELKKERQKRKLHLQERIQSALRTAYNNSNPKVTHFYNNINYNEVPLWAIFEVLTMGDFGLLLSSLNF